MNKQVVYKHNPKGQIVGLEEVHEFNSQNDISSIELLAKKNKQADDDEQLAIQKAESEEKEKQDKLNYEKSYYAKWRFVYACDSLLLDWQLDNGVSSDQKTEALKAKAEALEASGDCKNLLAKYDCVVARFIKIFGEAEQ
jgi:hypothetical protein